MTPNRSVWWRLRGQQLAIAAGWKVTRGIRKILCVYYATPLRGQPPRLFPRDYAAAAKEEVQSWGLIAFFSELECERRGQQSYDIMRESRGRFGG